MYACIFVVYMPECGVITRYVQRVPICLHVWAPLCAGCVCHQICLFAVIPYIAKCSRPIIFANFANEAIREHFYREFYMHIIPIV